MKAYIPLYMRKAGKTVEDVINMTIKIFELILVYDTWDGIFEWIYNNIPEDEQTAWIGVAEFIRGQQATLEALKADTMLIEDEGREYR